MIKSEWILCPICGNKTRIQLRENTILMNYPLYCPKCKQETLIEAKQFHVTIIKKDVQKFVKLLPARIRNASKRR